MDVEIDSSMDMVTTLARLSINAGIICIPASPHKVKTKHRFFLLKFESRNHLKTRKIVPFYSTLFYNSYFKSNYHTQPHVVLLPAAERFFQTK